MIACTPWRSVMWQMTAVLAVTALAGCSLSSRRPSSTEPVDLIAVMPIEREEAGHPVAGEPPRIAPGAERVVTAQIYGVLSSSSQWRFVPDLTVSQALSKADLTGDLPLRARSLGKQVGAGRRPVRHRLALCRARRRGVRCEAAGRGRHPAAADLGEVGRDPVDGHLRSRAAAVVLEPLQLVAVLGGRRRNGSPRRNLPTSPSSICSAIWRSGWSKTEGAPERDSRRSFALTCFNAA